MRRLICKIDAVTKETLLHHAGTVSSTLDSETAALRERPVQIPSEECVVFVAINCESRWHNAPERTSFRLGSSSLCNAVDQQACGRVFRG